VDAEENGGLLFQQGKLHWFKATILKLPFLALSKVLTLLDSLRDRALTSH
jgi:hypothetical protein